MNYDEINLLQTLLLYDRRWRRLRREEMVGFFGEGEREKCVSPERRKGNGKAKHAGLVALNIRSLTRLTSYPPN